MHLVPGEYVLIGATGLFVRQIEFPVGSPVVVRIRRGQDEVSLRGIVGTTYPGLGLSVEFKKKPSLGTEEIGGTTMKVRELAARLEKADPEAIVLIDRASQCLFLLNQRSGMFQPLGEHEAAATLTEPDKEFLRVLRVWSRGVARWFRWDLSVAGPFVCRRQYPGRSDGICSLVRFH